MKFDVLRLNGENLRSPLAEGRELKLCESYDVSDDNSSPLAEGRELKLCAGRHDMPVGECRPSRRGVN